MLVSTKVMDALKNIGLNLYERKLWVSLLFKGSATAGELSQMSNVPRSRTYDTLESLAEKGFVMIQPGKPVRFVAIKPEEALERVKRKIEYDLEETKRKIDELKKSALMKELNNIFCKGSETISPEEFTGTIKGTNQVNQQISSMIKNANKSIKIVTNAEGLKDLHEYHFEHLSKAKSRGVDIKIAAIVDENVDVLEPLNSVASIKTIKDSPVKGNFLIVDGKEVVFSLTNPEKVHKTQHVAVWSRSEHVASDVLEPLFKMIWGK
jgi:HTH-type transcriptional regulator, sugar sensing transcriptional regulator